MTLLCKVNEMMLWLICLKDANLHINDWQENSVADLTWVELFWPWRHYDCPPGSCHPSENARQTDIEFQFPWQPHPQQSHLGFTHARFSNSCYVIIFLTIYFIRNLKAPLHQSLFNKLFSVEKKILDSYTSI